LILLSVTADAYFEVGKQVTLAQPAAALVRREPEDRGASIIVRSEPSPPALPIGPSPIRKVVLDAYTRMKV